MVTQYLVSGSIRPTNRPWLSKTLMEEYPVGRRGYVAIGSCAGTHETRNRTRKKHNVAQKINFLPSEDTKETMILFNPSGKPTGGFLGKCHK
jgi:hypothetical protein